MPSPEPPDSTNTSAAEEAVSGVVISRKKVSGTLDE